MGKEHSQIYEFKDYRSYLKIKLATSGETRGMRTRVASLLNTKPSFVTQVLSGKNNLTPEHCPILNELLGHNPEESHFFILQVLHARAGSLALEDFYSSQISEIHEKRKNISERLKISENLSPTHQAVYYSKWYYAAIHLLTSIPNYQSITSIAQRLKLSPSLVSEAIEKLVEIGLLSIENGKIKMTEKRILLKKDSPWISQMHSHYRLRAIDSFSEPLKNDFHYSIGVSLSKKDYEKIREKILHWIEELDPLIKDSKEEEAYCLLIDLFQMI